MGDSEIKNEETQQNEPQKKTEKSAKKKDGFFKNIKSEFKRIVWPDTDTAIKESTAVVVVTVILGALIAVIDWAIKLGLDKILQL